MLSVIIINYNTFQMTSECIESIYKHTKDIDFEIILVDNASKECDANLFKEKFEEITVIKNNENLGFAKANNLALPYCKGDVILFLNSDTLITDNSLQKTYEKILNSFDIGILTCKLKYPDGTIQNQCRRFDTISFLLIEKLRLYKCFPKKIRGLLFLNGYFDHNTSLYPDRIWGTFFMFKKQILDVLPENKWSERFFMYGEDNEWCYQLRKYTPFKIFYFAEASIIHLMGGSKYGNEDNPEKIKTIEANKKTYLNIYYGSIKTKIYYWILNYLKY
jgi:GT2 family glycosyltransferase